MFALLSGNKVQEAVMECAVKLGFPRLASIIAACSTTHESKKCIAQQLEAWEKGECLTFMEENEVLLLQMLSGGSKQVFDRLEWKRRFGVFLWYRFASDRPLASVVKAFENFFSHLSSHAPPAHLTGVGSESEEVDFCFHVLKVFADSKHEARKMFRPESYGENQLDWHLCWFVRWAIARLPKRVAASFVRMIPPLATEASVGSALTVRFADQLETLGLWHWAVYIVLVCPDFVHKQHLVGGILDRNVGLSRDVFTGQNDDQEAFVESLAVAEWAWVKGALANARRLSLQSVKNYDKSNWTRVVSSVKLAVESGKKNEAFYECLHDLSPLVLSKVDAEHARSFAQILSAVGKKNNFLIAVQETALCPKGRPSNELVQASLDVTQEDLKNAWDDCTNDLQRHAVLVVGARLNEVRPAPSVVSQEKVPENYRSKNVWVHAHRYMKTFHGANGKK